MRRRFKVPVEHVVLIACTASLAALVWTAGWTWPLRAAAVMIPITALLMG